MRALLDTQVFLWATTDPDRLGAQRQRVEDPENELILSAVVGWEIAIKHGLGKLPLPEPPRTYVPSRAAQMGLEVLPVSMPAVLLVGDLPNLHRDPFDRLLIATAMLQRIPVITADRAFEGYDIQILRP